MLPKAPAKDKPADQFRDDWLIDVIEQIDQTASDLPTSADS
jgi:hypothetical protein